MRDNIAKRLGIEVVCKTRRTIEITMSEDWADCVAHQAEELLSEEKDLGAKQELRDLVSCIDEALR